MTPLEREIKVLTSAGLSEEFIVNHYEMSTEVPLKVTFVFHIVLWSILVTSIITISQAYALLNPFLLLTGVITSTLYWHIILHTDQKKLLVSLGYGEYHIIRIPNEQLISEAPDETPSSR